MKTVLMLACLSGQVFAVTIAQTVVSPSATIIYAPGNPPTITFTCILVAGQGAAKSVAWSFDDATPDVVTSGLTVTHTFPDRMGNYEVIIQVIDADLNPSHNDADIVIVKVYDGKPMLFKGETPFGRDCVVGGDFNYTLNVYGEFPLTLSATNLPAGLVFEPAAITSGDLAFIKGTPIKAGVVTGSVIVTNAYGTDSQPFRFVFTLPVKQTGDILTKGAFKRNVKKTDSDSLSLAWSGAGLLAAGLPAKDAGKFFIDEDVAVLCTFGPYSTGFLKLDAKGKAKNDHVSIAYNAQKAALTVAVKGINLSSIAGTTIDNLGVAKFPCKLQWQSSTGTVNDNNSTGLFKVSGKVTPLDSGKLVGQE